MNILFINATYGIGSTGKIVESIGKSLEKNGNQVFYGVKKTNKFDKKIFIIGNKLDWKLHSLLSRLFCCQGFCSKFSTFLFLKKIKKLNIDIVNLHNLHSSFINLHMVLSFCKKQNIKVILTMHDAWFFTGKCYHFIDKSCNSFMEKCGSCPKKRMPPKSLIFDRSSHYLKVKKRDYEQLNNLTVVSCSEWLLRFAKQGILKNSIFYLINNKIDTTFFVYKKKNKEKKLKILGFANKWVLPENEKIVKFYLNGDFLVTVVGCTKREIKYFSKFNKTVRLLPPLPKEKLLIEYQNADIFVNLSRADTYPTVNMESICCGTPVIAFRNCANPEIISTNTGCLIGDSEFDELEKITIEAALLDNELCSLEGEALFKDDKFGESYLPLFKK